MGLFSVVAVIFIVLKLFGLIGWSWWWVLPIFLGDIILVVVGIGLFATIAGAYFGFLRVLKKIFRC